MITAAFAAFLKSSLAEAEVGSDADGFERLSRGTTLNLQSPPCGKYSARFPFLTLSEEV
jgi:hypothetical protein